MGVPPPPLVLGDGCFILACKLWRFSHASNIPIDRYHQDLEFCDQDAHPLGAKAQVVEVKSTC